MLALSPGLFEKSEKRALYLLFAHALNFPTFRESRIIPCHLRVLWHQVRVYCRTFSRTVLTMAICVQGLDSAVLYAFLWLWGEAMALTYVHLCWLLMGFGKLQFVLRSYSLRLCVKMVLHQQCSSSDKVVGSEGLGKRLGKQRSPLWWYTQYMGRLSS